MLAHAEEELVFHLPISYLNTFLNISILESIGNGCSLSLKFYVYKFTKFGFVPDILRKY